MRLRDEQQLAGFMKANRMSQAGLARMAGVSRQFVHMLVRGDKRSCRAEVAGRIEEALHVLPGTLFVPDGSTATGRPVHTPGRGSEREPVAQARQ